MTSFDEVPEWIWGSRGASRSSRLPAKDWAAPSRKNSPAKALTWPLDRKSTRLNSSHSQISYAVFCLKKKNPSVNRLSHLTTPCLQQVDSAAVALTMHRPPARLPVTDHQPDCDVPLVSSQLLYSQLRSCSAVCKTARGP